MIPYYFLLLPFFLLPVRESRFEFNNSLLGKRVVLNAVIIEKGEVKVVCLSFVKPNLSARKREKRSSSLSSTVGSLACGKLDGVPFFRLVRVLTILRFLFLSLSHSFSLRFHPRSSLIFEFRVRHDDSSSKSFLSSANFSRPPKHVPPLFLCYFNIFIAACHE